MEKNLEHQRRQLWIDYFINYKSDLQLSTTKMIERCDELLAEFDKRFPQSSQPDIMNKEDFGNRLNDQLTKFKYKDQPNAILGYGLGAWDAYKILTGKDL